MWNLVKNPLWSVNSSGISLQNFTIVFQNTPYYKLEGHLNLPPVTVSASGGASSIAPEMGKGDVETTGVSTSEIAPSFTVWQQGFIRGNPERDFHIVLLNRNKKRPNATFGSDGPPSPFKAFQELSRGPAGLWGMGRDSKEAGVLLNAWVGVDGIQIQGPRPRAGHHMER